MNRSVTYHITEADASMQILDFLPSWKKGYVWKNLLNAEKNAISLNGEKAGGRTLLKNHDILNILVPETGSTEHKFRFPWSFLFYMKMKIFLLWKACGNAGASFHGKLRKYTGKRRCFLF